MRKTNMHKCMIACVLVLLLACPFPAAAQQAVNVEWWTPTNQSFRPEELDQMLAPIALYPDALLAQVLAASTYPRSVASADRFVKDNPRVPGQILVDVARDTDWSPSVKAMLLFPDVLAMMAYHLDWTRNLGEAFLAQQGDVMDSVQRLRYMAYRQGRLTTTRESVIRFDPRTQIIFIEPANYQMVYVPVYDPGIVYGTWRYPNYPPYRYYSPGYSNPSALSFLAGVLVGAGMGWGGWDFDWGHHRSNVHVENYNTFVNRSYASPDRYQISPAGGRTVVYDAQFRKNAGYKDYTTAQRFGGQQSSGPVTMQRAPVSRDAVQVQTRSTVLQTSKPERTGDTRIPRKAEKSSTKSADRPMESRSNIEVPNAGAVNHGSNEVSKASEVSQAAHSAQSEGLKGKDLAEKVHEAIDARKEKRDNPKAKDKAKEKDVTEKVKEGKDFNKKNAREER